MSANTASPDLIALRTDLSKFIRELSLENYLHFSGQKETLEIVPIYERYGHLVSKDLAKNLLERWQSVETDEDRKSYKHLHQFAFFGYLGNLNKELFEEMTKRQASMKIEFDGDEIGYHGIFPRLLNEPDPDKRMEIDDKACVLEEELNKLRMESWGVTFDVFREFGYPSYREGCQSSFQIDYDWLAGELRQFLDETEAAYIEAFNRLSSDRLGYPITEARKCDLGYLMRGGAWDDYFPKEGMVEKASGFLRDMGIPTDKTPAVILDTEEREKKRPRAFCSSVEPGKEVYVCVRPMGGMSDYLTFLHEVGHAYHFAHTDSTIDAELIQIGDSATSEVFAFNFNYLASDPEWLKTYIGIDDPSSIVEFILLQKMYFLRRYSSKLLYELELLSDYDIEGKSDLYTKYLDKGLKVTHRPENWLNDLDPAFYSAGYLRAWIFEMQLREHLISEFGTDWWRNPKAADQLKEYWSTGRKYMPEEMAERICGRKLDLGPIKREIMG